MVFIRYLDAPQCLNLPKVEEDHNKEMRGHFQITMEEDWESWAKLIKACVLLSKTPLTLYEINKDVKRLQGRDIPYRRLNFVSLEEMIDSINGLKVTQLNDTLKVVKTTVNEQVCMVVKHFRNRKQNFERKQKAANFSFSEPAVKLYILCVLTMVFICFNILLLIFDTPNTSNILRNDQTSINVYSKCPALKAPSVPSIGSIFDVRIAKATNPHNFIVQPFNNVYELETLMKELSIFCESYSGPPVAPSSLKVGNMYAAKYDENGRWYRAYVSKLISKTLVVVYFCDYGEYRVVSLEEIRPLENHFYNLPYQAIQAKLHGITPKLNNGWTLKDSLRFNELIIVKNFVSLIKSYESENSSTEEMILGLELIDTTSTSEGIYITNILVNENRADRTEELIVN